MRTNYHIFKTIPRSMSVLKSLGFEKYVSSFCDQDVAVDCFLTHNIHIKEVIIKCNGENGMIRRAVGYKSPAQSR